MKTFQFVHIPKTGGRWIKSVLATLTGYQEPSERHGLYRWHLPQADFSFAFVRHPVSWYESWWKFQAGKWVPFHDWYNCPQGWHPQTVLRDCCSDDFREFVRQCLAVEPGYVTRLYEWFVGPEGMPYVDFIGRYEHLVEDTQHALALIGINVSEEQLHAIAPIGVSECRAGQPSWDDQLLDKVRELEGPAIRRWYS